MIDEEDEMLAEEQNLQSSIKTEKEDNDCVHEQHEPSLSYPACDKV